MSETTYFLRSFHDGVRLAGIEQPTAELHHGSLDGTQVVLKVPGYKYWRGIGSPQGYSPASFQVYRREDVETTRWVKLADFPIRSDKDLHSCSECDIIPL